ncbi:armadillo-type protein [Phyllosticta citriasiana]|uniref:armadillo-type protein n=1 Tax=Phyllosticta citriasiana TaxID=595635 RepID=UPI0030FD8D4B
MNIPSLEIKKMCFLYLPEVALKALPSLLMTPQGGDHRAQDAAFCVAKLYDHDRHLVEHSDLIERSENIKLTIDYPSASKISIMPLHSKSNTLTLHDGANVHLEAMMNYIRTTLARASRRGIAPGFHTPTRRCIDVHKGHSLFMNNFRQKVISLCNKLSTLVTKLELIFMLATEKNINEVLTELREYATEIDVDFVRKSVSYIVQEATVVIRNIFRKYPNQYESIISTLCENLDSLDEPEAKAAMIWVIGQYADRIDNSDVLLDDFLYTFADERTKPTKGQELVPKVLKWATEETDNPDLRDRGYMYWRLLSSDQQLQESITAESEKLDPLRSRKCAECRHLAPCTEAVQQVFRSARPRRWPRAQLCSVTLSDVQAAADAQKRTNTVTPGSLDTLAAGSESTDGNMNLGNGGEFGGNSPVVGSQSNMYVVNQNQPQQVYQPAVGTGNGDLLLL